jgi:hypothetical protein
MFGYHSRFVRETLSEISTGDQPTRTNAKAGDKVGCFETRDQGSINLKRLGEFAAVHRADGWNTRLTFAISPAPPELSKQ